MWQHLLPPVLYSFTVILRQPKSYETQSLQEISKGEGRMNRESNTDAQTLSLVKQIPSGKLLYSTGSSAQCSVMTWGVAWRGGREAQEGKDTCIQRADSRASLVVQTVKNLPAMWEIQVQSLGQEDPLEKEMVPTAVFLPGEFHGQRNLVSQTQLSD